MKTAALVLALALSVANARLFTLDQERSQYMWASFKKEYGKTYSTPEEDAARFEIFVSNLALADERNVREHHAGGRAIHGVTKFMDLTPEEFASRYLTSKPTGKSNATDAQVAPLKRGSSVSQDWTGTLTTPVKDQGYCGSCWAFSATEQIESDTIRTLDTTYILSPAQIVSCDKTSSGCGGGWSEHAYDYVKQAGGLETESDYPYSRAMYHGSSGTCQSDSSDFKVTVDTYYTVRSESSMANYVSSTGPLSVCLDASSWSTYTGGVMSVCGHSVDHCVQAVGIDTTSRDGYWKVRNSWGTSWGESGYIRLKYGSNTCDITNDPTYATVELV